MKDDIFLFVIIFILVLIYTFFIHNLYSNDKNIELETIKKVQEVYKYDHCKLYHGKYYCYNEVND